MVSKDKKLEKLYNDYLELQFQYVDFSNYIFNKIKALLIENEITYQNITSRIKKPDSFYKKLYSQTRVFEKFHNVKETWDICGVRIILYNRDHIGNIKNLIYSNFSVINETLPRDNYDSTNITIQINKNNKFKDFRCEIQLTTLLVHAYNEFGHDIFYKDTDTLKIKNPNGYNKLKNLYDDTFKKIIEIESSMKIIAEGKDDILKGHNAVVKLCSKEFLYDLENCNNLKDLGNLIQDIKGLELTSYISDEVYKRLVDKCILLKLVKTCIKIFKKGQGKVSDNHYYNTIEYMYIQLLSVLQKFIYLCTDNLIEIISLIDDYTLNFCTYYDRKRFKDFCIAVLKEDKRNNFYKIHEIIYSYISNDLTSNKEIKLLFSEEYCNLLYENSSLTDVDTIEFSMRKISPNNVYKNNITKLIIFLSNEFAYNNDKDIFDSIRNIISSAYRIDKSSGDERVKHLFESINKNFTSINICNLYLVYHSSLYWNREKYLQVPLINKITKHRSFLLYEYIFEYYRFDNKLGFVTIHKSERDQYIEKFLSTMNNNKEDVVVDIVNALTYCEDWKARSPIAREFLFSVGKRYANSVDIYEKTNNLYIKLGIKSRENIKFTNGMNTEQVLMLIHSIIGYKNIYNNTLVDELFKFSKVGSNEDIDRGICQIILTDKRLYKEKAYKKKLMEYIDHYNKKNISLFENIGSYINSDELINSFNKMELKKLFNNFNFGHISFEIRFIAISLFRKHPDLFREFIFDYIKHRNNFDIDSDLSSIAFADNFKEELHNNIYFVIKLLRKYKSYKIMNYANIFLGKYDENVQKELISILKEEFDCVKEILLILRHMSGGIDSWPVIKTILEIDGTDKYYNDAKCILFSCMASGKYGIANEFQRKYNFFNDEIKSNKLKGNVLKFMKIQRDMYKNRISTERLRADKDEIFREEGFKFKYKQNNRDVENG